MASIKYNSGTLQKLELLFKACGYQIRYEKGNFTSGYCLILDKSVVVVNKFFNTEARINCLLDILQEIEINVEALDEKSRSFLHVALSAKVI